jgi:hypothetical protein
MTRILWYTDAATAGSISGTTALGNGSTDGTFGTSKARPTTRTGFYDNVIVAGLLAMGFTQSNQATRDDVWTSNGETGAESISFRTQYDGTSKFFIYAGTKVNGSGALQGSIGGGLSSFESFNLGTSDFTMDYILLGSKDFLLLNMRAATAGQAGAANLNDQFNCFIGNLERDNLVNPNTLTSSATASAGSNVVISVNQNPSVNDYKPGDMVQIVSIATGDAAQAQTVRITATTNTSIEVDSLAATYSAGARIGALPLPIVRFMSRNIDADDTGSWYSPLILNAFTATSDLATAPGQVLNKVELAAGTTQTAQDGFGTGTTANKRTRRFSCRALELKGTNEAVLGRIPGLYAYPGSASYYPNDTYAFNRVTPHQRFVSSLWVSGGTKNWIIGKSP